MRVRMLAGMLLATTIACMTGCAQSPPPPPAPHYRVTGVVRASCYQAPPTVPQGSCTMHAQIQNEGGHGPGGIGQLILYYRANGSEVVITSVCEKTFPPLDTKDVAEIDCLIFGDQLIYSGRIVGTDIKILPPAKASPTASGAPTADTSSPKSPDDLKAPLADRGRITILDSRAGGSAGGPRWT